MGADLIRMLTQLERARGLVRTIHRLEIGLERNLRIDDDILIAGLPTKFAGLRIVQISDIHHGLFLPKEWLSDAVRQANPVKPTPESIAQAIRDLMAE